HGCVHGLSLHGPSSARRLGRNTLPLTGALTDVRVVRLAVVAVVPPVAGVGRGGRCDSGGCCGRLLVVHRRGGRGDLDVRVIGRIVVRAVIPRRQQSAGYNGATDHCAGSPPPAPATVAPATVAPVTA